MTVNTILNEKGTSVFTMAPDASLADVTRELSHRRIGAVLIMEGEDLVGILSERDVVRALAQDGPHALQSPASDVMTRRVEVCHRDDLINEVMSRMTASRFRHMPVVENGRVIAVVSIGDVVKQRIEEAVRERDDLQAYIHSI